MTTPSTVASKLDHWDAEGSPKERAEAIVTQVEWSMNNFLPAKDESGAQCERRRMVEAIAAELSELRALLHKDEANG